MDATCLWPIREMLSHDCANEAVELCGPGRAELCGKHFLQRGRYSTCLLFREGDPACFAGVQI